VDIEAVQLVMISHINWLAMPINELVSPLVQLVGGDKVFHFGGFFLISWLVFCLGRWARLISFAMAGMLVFAVVAELSQNFMPNRTVSVGDWVANSLGVGFAYAITVPPVLINGFWGRYQVFVVVRWLQKASLSVYENHAICPDCHQHSWQRHHRNGWMRCLRGSTLMTCVTCASRFLFWRRFYVRMSGFSSALLDASGQRLEADYLKESRIRS